MPGAMRKMGVYLGLVEEDEGMLGDGSVTYDRGNGHAEFGESRYSRGGDSARLVRDVPREYPDEDSYPAEYGAYGLSRRTVSVAATTREDRRAAFSNYGDEDWEYVARPEPLSVNKNALHIAVKPGPKLGAPAVVDVDQSAFTIRNRVLTSAVKQPFHIACDELDTAGVLERDADGKAIVDVWGTIAGDYDKGKPLVMKSPSPSESFGQRPPMALLVGIAPHSAR